MGLGLTLILMASGLGVFGLAAWRSSLPANPLRGPRLIPWTLIAITAAAFTLVVTAHLLGIFGIETGQGRPRL